VAGSLTFAILFENRGYTSKWALQIFWEPSGKWVYTWIDNYCGYVFHSKNCPTKKKHENYFLKIHQFFDLKKMTSTYTKGFYKGKIWPKLARFPQKNSKSLEFNVKFQLGSQEYRGFIIQLSYLVCSQI
jgi:hypothetical protein